MKKINHELNLIWSQKEMLIYKKLFKNVTKNIQVEVFFPKKRLNFLASDIAILCIR